MVVRGPGSELFLQLLLRGRILGLIDATSMVSFGILSVRAEG